MDSETGLMTKTHRDVSLVGGLVLAEPRVSIDPEERPALRSGIGHEVLGDPGQLGSEIGDELKGRFLDVVQIASLVGVEPVPSRCWLPVATGT